MADRKRILFRADVVYDGLGMPRTDAGVLVERHSDGEGAAAPTIVAIDDAASLSRAYPEAGLVDVGFAISPPPVNAHTHFDLGAMPRTERSYVDFVRAVVAHTRTGERNAAAAEAGVRVSLDYGVRVVGDIATTVEGMRFMLETPSVKGVAYWEVIGPDPDDAESIVTKTVEQLRAFRSWERPGGARVGLAPHSAHTVSGPLLQRLAEIARANRLPVQIHLAETPEERAMFLSGTGALAEMMRAVGAPFDPPGASPVRYLERLGVLAARPTLVHMVEVDEDDVRRVQHAGCCVVHCPRSNAALGARRFPWELYAKHGVSVGFGTDSLASSPSLSPVEEVAAARAWHGDSASAAALVRAAVKGGHRALGRKPPTVARGAPAAELVAWTGSGTTGLHVYTAQHTDSAHLA